MSIRRNKQYIKRGSVKHMSKKNIHLELEGIKEPLKQVSVLAICSIIKKHFKFLGAQPINSLIDLIPTIPNNIDKDIISEIETLKDEEVLDTINNILTKCDLENIKNYIMCTSCFSCIW